MGRRPVRTLIVDDYEPWRRFLRWSFLTGENLQVIGEAADGLEAVQQGRKLQPDLILLDIGLPAMNGIEAARVLREVSPKSKVVFVSENRSLEILQEILGIGASGYVIKSDAGRELLPAIRAVLEGKQFVSSSSLTALDAGLADRARPQIEDAPIAAEKSAIQGRHEAIFYSDERVLLDRVTLFIGNALRTGNAAVVLANGSHRGILHSRLQKLGVEISRVVEQGRYLAFDAEEALVTFTLKGVLDRDRFLNLFQNLIMTASGSATARRSRVAVFGECVDLLWADGNAEAAIQMERLGNELTGKYEVDILCGYSLSHGQMHPDIHRLICEQHSYVLML